MGNEFKSVVENDKGLLRMVNDIWQTNDDWCMQNNKLQVMKSERWISNVEGWKAKDDVWMMIYGWWKRGGV